MVDHFSDLIYVHLTRSSSQEETLEGKVVFDLWDAIFGAKIKIYHAKNGRLFEQTLRSAIYDAKQTMKICGVGAYHQKDIAERKN